MKINSLKGAMPEILKSFSAGLSVTIDKYGEWYAVNNTCLNLMLKYGIASGELMVGRDLKWICKQFESKISTFSFDHQIADPDGSGELSIRWFFFNGDFNFPIVGLGQISPDTHTPGGE